MSNVLILPLNPYYESGCIISIWMLFRNRYVDCNGITHLHRLPWFQIKQNLPALQNVSIQKV